MPMIRTRLVSLKNAMKVFTNGGITWRMACSRRREGAFVALTLSGVVYFGTTLLVMALLPGVWRL